MKKSRVLSIDLLRGVVMIIMALDHTRDYLHAGAYIFDPVDLQKTNVFLFFTRWVTNYCAPIFMLLAGTSSSIVGQYKTKKELSFFLFTRGLWMVFLELTVVDFAWFFNVHFSFFLLAVIWALGISMIALSVLIHLRRTWILIIGIVFVAAHNLLDRIHVSGNGYNAFDWAVLHETKFFHIGGRELFVAYPVIPWIGLMALGYCLGYLYHKEFDPLKRKKTLVWLGSGLIILFLIVRGINIYGDLHAWARQRSAVFTVLSFINVSKYPPSLDYILITIGPALLFLAYTEGPLNRLTSMISVYGRVPLFYYIIHIFLIHLIALIASLFSGYSLNGMTNINEWVIDNPILKGYGFGLGVVYFTWIAVVLSLYPLCKWYDRYKSLHKDKWWLSYL